MTTKMRLIKINDLSLRKITGLNTDIILWILIGIVLILIILMLIQLKNNKYLVKRYKQFMKGSEGKSLEKILKDKSDKFTTIEEQENYNRCLIEDMMKQYRHSIQKTGLIKYDAFNESGGRLSFTLALLDAKNNGFVINTIHSEEGCYTYIKDIINGNSVVLLSKEEKMAVEKAMNSFETRK